MTDNLVSGICDYCHLNVNVPYESMSITRRNPSYNYIYQFVCSHCGELTTVDAFESELRKNEHKSESSKNEHKQHKHHKNKDSNSKHTRNRNNKQ